MHFKKNHLIFAVVWIFLCSLAVASREALLLSLALPPILWLILQSTIQKGYIILSLFMAFTFLSHAINPILFFVNKDKYTHSGWGAVKNFDFNLIDFINIYLYVYFLILVIFATTFMVNYIGLNARQKNSNKSNNSNMEDKYLKSGNRKNRRVFSLLLWSILVFSAAINIYMYKYQIGIVGLNPTVLPFKLTGVLYYFRGIVLPIIILILYSNSGKSTCSFLAIIIYAIFAGILSASRAVLIFSAVAVLISSFLEKERGRIIFSLLILVIAYHVVGIVRVFVYVSEIEMTNLIINIWQEMEIGKISLIEMLWAISERLYGAQSMVLAYQYELEDQLWPLLHFFVDKPILGDMAFDLYHLALPEDKAYGVTIGLFGALILLSNKNLAILFVLGSIISWLLIACEKMVRKIALIRGGTPSFKLISYCLSFFLVFMLYNARMKLFYLFFLVTVLVGIYWRKSYSTSV